MAHKITRSYTTEAFTEKLSYATQHGTLTLTVAVIPQENDAPRVYVSNEDIQLHHRPRCKHITQVEKFARVYHYEPVCVAMHDDWEYILELRLVDTTPIRSPIVDELMGKDPNMEPERRWTLLPTLRQCIEVPLANETRDIPEEVFTQ
jgi:hypothetical protein